MSTYTTGTTAVYIGTAAPSGVMPALGAMTKIGEVYENTIKIAQDKADRTEHKEEGRATPKVIVKQGKNPNLTFSLMNVDNALLAKTIGGTNNTSSGIWSYNGQTFAQNAAIALVPEQGLQLNIPNADIEGVLNGDMSKKGILLIEMTIAPLATTNNMDFQTFDGSVTLSVSPTTLSFTAAADSTGKTITASSTGNLTYAGADSSAEWLQVTRSGKVATVKVSANTNSEARTANVTLVADGLTAVVAVTQAGA